MGFLISSIGIGIYLSIFIIYLVNKINKIIKNADVYDIADGLGLGLACLFLASSIVFLILIILELISKYC